MNDLILRQDAIDAIRTAYFDKDIQSAKDDPCIVDAMTDWAIRQIKNVPTFLGDIVRTLNNGTIVFTTESLDWFNRVVLEDGKMNQKEFYQNDDWIPCSERLPNVGEYVFRTIRKIGWDGAEYKAVDIGLYDTNDGSIIAWMPLPRPWKGEL